MGIFFPFESKTQMISPDVDLITVGRDKLHSNAVIRPTSRAMAQTILPMFPPTNKFTIY